jgi:hypothetical protein
MNNRRLVYTNKTVDFKTWCEQAQERFQFLEMAPFDESALRPKHAYELGYTPDSWARSTLITVDMPHCGAIICA